MLIVIIIIGILAAALVPRLLDVQIRARDTKRKTDLRSIYTALEVYFLDNQSYPLAYSGASYNSNHSTYSTISTRTGLLSADYITNMPVDPRNV